MATFYARAGTDWLAALVFGDAIERWRLDDYAVALHVKRPGSATVLIEATVANGRLVIADARARRLEIDIGWPLIEAVLPGNFEFDLLFENAATGIRSRTETHDLHILPAITLEITT